MFLTPSEFLTFVVATLAVMATPGVTVSSITGTTLARGASAGFAMELGVNLARISMMVLLGLGLEVISSWMSAMFVWVKLAGAAYLVWLGIQAIRHPPDLKTASQGITNTSTHVAKGFAVLWSNPKAFIFLGAFIPQFVHSDAPVWPQLGMLAAIWVVIATVTDGLYILLASKARTAFQGSARNVLGWVSGTVLIGAGLLLALQRQS